MEPRPVTIHQDPHEITAKVMVEGAASGILMGGNLNMILEVFDGLAPVSPASGQCHPGRVGEASSGSIRPDFARSMDQQ